MGKSKNKSSSDPPKSDLTQLINITEDEISATLDSNFSANPSSSPYTSIGSSVLVAVRPSHPSILSSITDESTQKSWYKHYRDTTSSSSSSNSPSVPHIWGVANSAYLHLRRTGKNQSIILSGESGSGKTLQTKLLIEQLCEISGNSKKMSEFISVLQPPNLSYRLLVMQSRLPTTTPRATAAF